MDEKKLLELNKKLVEYLKSVGVIKSEKVEKAFLETPRHLFVPKNLIPHAYQDVPLPIGAGQTISQPTTVAIMTELLDVKEGNKVLEIGTGSGWQAAILSRLVGTGKVYTIERLKSLCETAKNNLKKLDIKNVEVVCKDGSDGLKEKAPFDRIIVTAAVPKIPSILLQQLKIGGKLVAPVGSLVGQKMVLVEKKRGEIRAEQIPDVFRFVPLRGKYGFKE